MGAGEEPGVAELRRLASYAGAHLYPGDAEALATQLAKLRRELDALHPRGLEFTPPAGGFRAVT